MSSVHVSYIVKPPCKRCPKREKYPDIVRPRRLTSLNLDYMFNAREARRGVFSSPS
jgi:hypothetical protein